MVNKKAFLTVAALLVTALVLTSLVATHTARSQGETNPSTTLYLQIDTIWGESTGKDHEDWIDLEMFNWSEAMASIAGAAGGRAAGRVGIEDFRFFARTTKASPELFLAVATGRRIPHAKLDVCRISGENELIFLKFLFDDVVITSYNIGGTTMDSLPLEQFSIAFSKITMTYRQILSEGGLGPPITRYFDLRRNTGG